MCGFCQVLDVFDDVLLFGVIWCVGIGECFVVYDDVVLKILDDYGVVIWIEVYVVFGKDWCCGCGCSVLMVCIFVFVVYIGFVMWVCFGFDGVDGMGCGQVECVEIGFILCEIGDYFGDVDFFE